jgi:GTP-binding protein
MEIRKAEYLISSVKTEGCPKPDRPEYAFIGRSNVGKSSLLNMLTGQKSLAKVSSTPGKTTTINHFNITSTDAKDQYSQWYLVDLPGYGYAKRSQTQRAAWEKMIGAYLRDRENLVTIFVLIDSRHEPQKADLEFLDKLGKWEVPFNLVFTKADKSTQRVTSANVRLFVNKMKEDWEFIPRTFVTSTTKGQGKRELLAYIEELNAQVAESGADKS